MTVGEARASPTFLLPHPHCSTTTLLNLTFYTQENRFALNRFGYNQGYE